MTPTRRVWGSLCSPLEDPESLWTVRETFRPALAWPRSGLELDVDAIKRAGTVALRLTVLPGVSEAIVVGTVGMFVFKIPFMLSLSMGFIQGGNRVMGSHLSLERLL